MRKLSVVIALSAAATLGLAGTAWADGHEETLCPNIYTDNPILNAENFAQDPSGGNGEPLNSTLAGVEETCKQSNSEVGLQPSPTLCGVASGLDSRTGSDVGTSTVGAVNDGLADVFTEGPPVGMQKCATPDPDDPDTGTTNNGGGGGDAAVQAANAGPDGGLPRTGGELFAGAGFAVMSLGALIRRFIS